MVWWLGEYRANKHREERNPSHKNPVRSPCSGRGGTPTPTVKGRVEIICGSKTRRKHNGGKPLAAHRANKRPTLARGKRLGEAPKGHDNSQGSRHAAGDFAKTRSDG